MLFSLSLHEVPKEDFAKSGEIAASVFFTTVFRSRGAETALNVLVLLSAFGNLLAVLIGHSRMIREIGRYACLSQCSPPLDTGSGTLTLIYRLQAGSLPVPQLLGVHEAFRHATGPLPPEVGHDLHHDRGSTCRRRLHLR